jgi:hypothetical protein
MEPGCAVVLSCDRHSRDRKGKKPKLLFLAVLPTILLAGIVVLAQESRSAGWVVISVDQYRELRAKAFPREAEPEPPPVDATLTRVDYDLLISGDLAAGKANLTIDVLKDAWVRVPIPGGLFVREARLEGKLVSLVPSSSGKGGNQLSALFSHAGRSLLQLDIAVPVASAAGNESLALPASESGVTQASLRLPRQGVDVRIAGGLLSQRQESATETRWVAYGRGSEPLVFTWRKKTEDHRSTQPLRLRGSLTELASLGEDSTSIYAEVTLEVAQGVAPAVKVQLPENVTINQVQGAMVADWEVKAGELTVTFLEPIEQTARLVIAGESRLPRDGQIDIPWLGLLNTERDSGGLAVEVLGAGEIKDLKSQGLEAADASDLGDMVASRQSPSLIAFRVRAGDSTSPRSLSVNVARYTQQAVLMANVEEARYQILMSKEGKMLVEARYAVRNNQRNFIKVALPSGAILWSAALSGKPVRPGQTPDGSLLLPLEKSRAGEDAPVFVVEILYLTKGTAWAEKGKARLALPALDLPVSRTGLWFYYPPLFRVAAEPGTFRIQAYEIPSSSALGTGVPGGAMGGVAGGTVGALVANAPMPLSNQEMKDENQHMDQEQALVEKYRSKSQAGKVTGILPVGISFPAFGPSVFLVSELTSENQAPSAEISYQHEKKGGTR